LEDAGTRGCQGRVEVAGKEEGCDHVRAGTSATHQYTQKKLHRDMTEARGLTLTVGGINANDILKVTVAAGELAIGVRRGHVVGTSQKIDSAEKFFFGQPNGGYSGMNKLLAVVG